MPTPFLSLTRDAQGRIIRRSLNLGGEAEIRAYAYDSAGRLARVTDDSGSLLESYQYDHAGRRLAAIDPQRFTGERRCAYSPSDRLLQACRVQYGHDCAGFRSLKVEATSANPRATQYRYESSGLLLAVDPPDGRRIEYAYDSAGLRREKRIDGRLAEAFRWMDPLRLLEFYDGRAWRRLAYDPARPSRTPIGVTDGDAAYFLLCDQLGAPRALADLSGKAVRTMRYGAFGNPLRGLQGGACFAGGLYDADTGPTRFVWRDYDADAGRFTALGPMGATKNEKGRYGSCVDDPVNRADAWGLESGSNAEEAVDGDSPREADKHTIDR